jgi:DNA-binding GntR family transcriptional regulator
MEALRRLATEGLVEIIPQVGCRVPVYSDADVADFSALFAGMEGAVASAAAQRQARGQLDELVRVNAVIARLSDDPEPATRAYGYRASTASSTPGSTPWPTPRSSRTSAGGWGIGPTC